MTMARPGRGRVGRYGVWSISSPSRHGTVAERTYVLCKGVAELFYMRSVYENLTGKGLRR